MAFLREIGSVRIHASVNEGGHLCCTMTGVSPTVAVIDQARFHAGYQKAACICGGYALRCGNPSHVKCTFSIDKLLGSLKFHAGVPFPRAFRMLNRDPPHGFSFQSVVDAIGGIGDDHEDLFDCREAIAFHAQGGAVDGFPQQ